MHETYWLTVTVVVDETAASHAHLVLERFAADDEGISITQEGDPNDIRPKAMLPDHHVTLYVDGGRDSAELRADITQACAENNLPAPKFAEQPKTNWMEAWKENYRPTKIDNRIWIAPVWEQFTPPDGDLLITLEPNMAFGTGTHETTQLCLQALERIVRPNDTVFDVGCGSGVLAIGASLLGAQSIIGVDIVPEAITETVSNAQLNNVTNITAHEGSLAQVTGQFDVVVANILFMILDGLIRDEGLFDFVRADGTLILSGILTTQLSEIEVVLDEAGGRIIDVLTAGEWIAIIAKRTLGVTHCDSKPCEG